MIFESNKFYTNGILKEELKAKDDIFCLTPSGYIFSAKIYSIETETKRIFILIDNKLKGFLAEDTKIFKTEYEAEKAASIKLLQN